MKKRIKEKNWKELVLWSQIYKKIDTEKLENQQKEQGEYIKTMNLQNSRMIFKKSSYLIHTVKMNWKNHYKGDTYECEDCLSLDPPVSHPDDQDLLMSSVCEGNSDLRRGRDMFRLHHQAQFYRELVQRRNMRRGHTDTK